MSNKTKQTAVEWLEEMYNSRPAYEEFISYEEFEQAKEMEKEQIMDAYNKGTVHGIDYPESTLPITGEQYYNETYGGNK